MPADSADLATDATLPSPGAADDAPRRTGRPRTGARPSAGADPVNEILAAASQLFEELGVGGTTMSRIAAAVGLRQSSLYYYFRRKEDLVAALVAQANIGSLALAKDIVAAGGSAPSQVYRFVRDDVIALCALPFDINEIHRMAARDPEGFHAYWEERADIARQVAKMLRRGVKDGSLRTINVRRTALTVMANDEGTQNWYRTGPQGSAGALPAEVATELADLVVAGLLAAGHDLETVRSEVASLD